MIPTKTMYDTIENELSHMSPSMIETILRLAAETECAISESIGDEAKRDCILWAICCSLYIHRKVMNQPKPSEN